MTRRDYEMFAKAIRCAIQQLPDPASIDAIKQVVENLIVVAYEDNQRFNAGTFRMACYRDIVCK